MIIISNGRYHPRQHPIFSCLVTPLTETTRISAFIAVTILRAAALTYILLRIRVLNKFVFIVTQ